MKTHFSRLFLFFSYTFFINIISYANDYKYINDSIQKTDTINKQNNNTLLGKITYEATDTTSISPQDKLIRLYNNAKINYQDMEITSGIIIVDYDKNAPILGTVKFNKYYHYVSKKLVPLGGIKISNLNTLKNLGASSVAISSAIKKKPAKIFSRLF